MENNKILSERVLKLTESATIEMTRKSRELRQQGKDVITLSLGEPDFDTPQAIKEAGIQAIKDNYTHYPPVAGYDSLRKAIKNKLFRDNKLDYDVDQIVVSNGAKQSLANVMLSILNPGDEVIIPAPYWVSYPDLVRMGEGNPVIIQTHIKDHYKINAQELKSAITSKTKAFLFNSPSNPTGSIYSREEIQELVDVLQEHPNILIIADEIYEHICFDSKHLSIGNFPEVKDRVITVNGVSKGFAMTGWRIGYIAAPKEIAWACTKIQGQYTSGPGTISQMAAQKAIESKPEDIPEVAEMVEAFRNRRDLVIRELEKIDGIKTYRPSGAFYIFPDVSHFFGKSTEGYEITCARDLCMYILEKANVAVVTGEAFGEPNGIRISYATSDDILIEAISRIKTALDALS